MSAPRLLIDNDILILLSCSGLLDDAINALGFDRPSAFRLDSLPYMIDTHPTLHHLSDEHKNLIKASYDGLPVTVESPNTTTLASLARIRHIDDGEAVLYAIASDDSTYLITSGDKVAMRALASAPTLQDIRKSLAGRIICLETICLELIKQRDAFQIAASFAPVLPIHTSLKTYFGSIDYSGEEGCNAAIQHYLAQLNEQLGDGFLWSR